jgi:hypothetical protein
VFQETISQTSKSMSRSQSVPLNSEAYNDFHGHDVVLTGEVNEFFSVLAPVTLLLRRPRTIMIEHAVHSIVSGRYVFGTGSLSFNENL